MTGIYLKLKFRCKLVVEIRDIWPLTLIEEGGYHRYNPLIIILSIIEKTGYYFADTIVGTMPNLVEHVKSVIKVERPVECIPMGVPHQSLTETAEVSHEFIKEYFNEDYFNVVHAGTIGLTNALSTFFEAAELALCQDDIRFILLGDGVMKDAYKEKYGHLGNVIFAPKVDRKQVQYTLAHADILYLSSFNSKVWDYGQSLNKLVDYMLAGKPIIASYSGYPSMIDEADCGYFIPAEDPISLVEKIKSLKSLPAKERQIMGNRGRDWLIENRNYKKLAEKYISFLFDSKVS